MAVLRIEMDGMPVAYSRPRFRSKRKPKGTGTPQAQRALQDLTWLVRAAVTTYRREEGYWDSSRPVRVAVEFEFAGSKREGGRGRGYGRTIIKVEQIEDERHHIGTSDLDNLSKLAFEGLQHGGAIEDDRLVVELRAGKRREKRWER